MKTEVELETISEVSTDTDIKLSAPGLYNVVYINDNVTTMEFVVESLKVIFHHSEETAQDLTVKIHDEGSSVVKTLPYEIAEQKGVEVTVLARNNGFPLNVKLEPS